MCTEVFINPGPDARWVEDQGTLKEALGIELTYDREMPDGAINDGGCLCWVDIPATAKRAGYSAVWDAGNYLLHKE